MVPAGGLLITSVAGAELIVMVSSAETLCAGLPESTTLTVTWAVSATVGVPLTVQFVARFRPAGNVPDTMLHV